MLDEEEKQAQPIIIVKKKGGHGGHHGGAWKVAYADFVTAMMAFFLVMWLVGQSDEIKAAVAGYFTDPVAYGKLKGGEGILRNGPGVRPQIPNINDENRLELLRLRQAAENIRNMMKENSDLADLSDQVEMTITSRGLKIQLVDKEDEMFFEVGSDILHPNASKILKIIGEELAGLKNDIVIEGHTDSRKYSGNAYTNWELSADRAGAARYVLMQNGVTNNQIFGIEGYGDRFPKIAENPMDGRNRRVAIIVLVKDAAREHDMYEIGQQIFE